MVRPEPEIAIVDRYRPRSDLAFLRRAARAALAVGRRRFAISLLLTDEREIARIHDRFLGDPTGTDVISFLVDDTVELVVSVERARREARRRGHAIKAELALYVVHGILHACGYDDIAEADRVIMRAAEGRALARLGCAVRAE